MTRKLKTCPECGKQGEDLRACDTAGCPIAPEKRVVLDLFIDAGRRKPESLADASNLEIPTAEGLEHVAAEDLPNIDSTDVGVDFDDIEMVDVDEVDEVAAAMQAQMRAASERSLGDPDSEVTSSLEVLRHDIARDDLRDFPAPKRHRPAPQPRKAVYTKSRSPVRRRNPPPAPGVVTPPSNRIHVEQTLEMAAFRDAWDAGWDYLSMLAPIVGAICCIFVATQFWVGPATPFVVYLFAVLPLAVVARLGPFRTTELERTVGSPFFLGNLILGALITASWSLAATREAVLNFTDEEVALLAVEDWKPEIAAVACQRFMAARGASPSEVAKVIEATPVRVLETCLTGLQGAGSENAVEYMAFRFDQQVRSGEADPPTCDELGLLRTVAPRHPRLLPSAWLCLAGESDADLRGCCADTVRILASLENLTPAQTAAALEPTEAIASFMLATAFGVHGALDEASASIAQDLDLDGKGGRSAAVKLACHRDLVGNPSVLSRATVVLSVACPRGGPKGRLTPRQWSDLCAAASNSEVEAMCGTSAVPIEEDKPAPTILETPVISDFD